MEHKTLLITGATGFIGQRLVSHLQAQGYSIICLSRDAGKARRILGDEINAIENLDTLDGQMQIHGIINLAGANIGDQRWSEARKAELLDSRLNVTQSLIDLVARLEHKPEALVSGSAVGYYGPHLDEHLLDEYTDHIQPGFQHDLCARWEQAARQAEEYGVRVCLVRTAVVLGPGGGALAKMLPPFKMGLGGRIASGRQWFSWVHLEDEVAAICHLLEHTELSGAFNLAAPDAVQNAEFTRQLAHQLKRPAIFPVPGFMLGLMLGEGRELLEQGQKVYPKRLLDSGFSFRYPALEPALRDVLGLS